SAQPRRTVLARLACVRHAASVRPEPGSNSPKEKSDTALFNETLTSVNVRNQSTLVSLVQLRSEAVRSDSRAAQVFRKPELSKIVATVGGQLWNLLDGALNVKWWVRIRHGGSGTLPPAPYRP